MWFFGNGSLSASAPPPPSPTPTPTPVPMTGFDLLHRLGSAVYDQSNSKHMSGFVWPRVSGITRYCCSIYGVSCLVMALVLNRTFVMASTNNTRNQQAILQRQREGEDEVEETHSKWSGHVLVSWGLRLGVIVALSYNLWYVLVALNFVGHTTRLEPYAWLPDKLFGYSSDTFADVNYMKTPRNQVMVGPTTDMYWPVFLSFCLSSFVETLLSVLAGKKPYTESGITIFEHSFAFQEFSSNGAFIFGGNSGLGRRPTEEVLMSSFFSLANHLNIHVGGLVNDNRYRLVPSTITGIMFLGYFANKLAQGFIFRFPVILVVTFLPQVLIVLLVTICASIFAVAVLANAGKLENLNYASFLLVKDDEDGQRFDIHWHDDFYTALLSLGMLAISSAGKSSYITELSLVNMDDATWLDRSVWQNLRVFAAGSSSPPELRKGYGHVVVTPSKRMITAGVDRGSGNIHDDNEDMGGYRQSSILGRRLQVVRLMTNHFVDLCSSLVKTKVSDNVAVPKFLQSARRKDEEVAVMVNIDDWEEDAVAENFHSLVFGEPLSAIDSSPDYEVEEVEEDESDIEEVDDIFAEVVSPELMGELSSAVMSSHISHGRITRSRFRALVPSIVSNQTEQFMQLVLERRQPKPDGHEDSRLDCVICQVTPREIITWPCKCFAICEGCRLALVSKGMEGCVCCRRDVEGVSKVFVP